MSDIVESFLELYSKPRIKKEYRLALAKFFEWAEVTPDQIVEEWHACMNWRKGNQLKQKSFRELYEEKKKRELEDRI